MRRYVIERILFGTRRAAILLAAGLIGCGGSDYGGTSPVGGGGGPVGSVTVGGGVQFVSRHNGTMNPAVDTIAAGAAMTWTWSGGLSHSVRSTGALAFPSSDNRTAGTYSVTFVTPGTYHYDCAVHGAAMSGTVVVTAQGAATQTVPDPVGDVFATGGTQWDLTGFTVARDTNGVTAQLDFSTNVLSPMSGDSAAIIGFVEFDLDQSEATGGSSVVDEFRNTGGATGLGVDATVDLSLYDADSSVAVYDAQVHVTGRIKPLFTGHSIVLRIPRAMLGNDDGFLNAGAIIGAVHRPTDFVPQDGHLTLTSASRG